MSEQRWDVSRRGVLAGSAGVIAAGALGGLATAGPAAAAPQTAEGARERVLEAALDLFGERGLNGTTVRDIAARAKVNVAAISYHLGGKDELYRAVAGMVIGSIEARVRSRVARILDEPPRDPESALLALENLVAFAEGRPVPNPV